MEQSGDMKPLCMGLRADRAREEWAANIEICAELKVHRLDAEGGDWVV